MTFWTEVKLGMWDRFKFIAMGAAVGFVAGAMYGFVIHDLVAFLIHRIWW